MCLSASLQNLCGLSSLPHCCVCNCRADCRGALTSSSDDDDDDDDDDGDYSHDEDGDNNDSDDDDGGDIGNGDTTAGVPPSFSLPPIE